MPVNAHVIVACCGFTSCINSSSGKHGCFKLRSAKGRFLYQVAGIYLMVLASAILRHQGRSHHCCVGYFLDCLLWVRLNLTFSDAACNLISCLKLWAGRPSSSSYSISFGDGVL